MNFSEKQGNEIVESVERAFAGLAEAAKSLDVDKYVEFFDKEKFTALNEDGTVTHTFEEFIETYLGQISSVKEYQSLEFLNVKITVVNANTAILVNEFKAKVVLKSGDVIAAGGAGTQVWAESDGNWRLVSVSSSSKP